MTQPSIYYFCAFCSSATPFGGLIRHKRNQVSPVRRLACPRTPLAGVRRSFSEVGSIELYPPALARRRRGGILSPLSFRNSSFDIHNSKFPHLSPPCRSGRLPTSYSRFSCARAMTSQSAGNTQPRGGAEKLTANTSSSFGGSKF